MVSLDRRECLAICADRTIDGDVSNGLRVPDEESAESEVSVELLKCSRCDLEVLSSEASKAKSDPVVLLRSD